MRRAATPLLLALLWLGCSNPGKPYHYPLDTVLRLDHVQEKGTHNSYHVESTDIPEWEYTMPPLDVQLDRDGVRQIELDLHWIKDDNGEAHHFEVYHVVLADEATTCQQFRDCLHIIKDWSDRYPGHLPIYIQLEPKDGFVADQAEPFFSDLEGDILAVFPRHRVITPDEVQGTAATLPEAIAGGWPTLDKLRGRVFFGFDNRDEVRAAYTYGLTSLHGRLSFVDSDVTDPFGAITILNDPVPMAQLITAAAQAHLLVRTRSDEDGNQARANDTSWLDAALPAGGHFISTDFPEAMGALPYVVNIPGGTPARCNPVTAPPECTSLALEDPQFVGSGTP